MKSTVVGNWTRLLPYVALAAIMVLSAGCYHAKVTTGLMPGTKVIERPFASAWVFGLVPPSTVETASECTDGIAVVETELSFVNSLVSSLTFGIFTPMHIKVTCAAPGTTSTKTFDHALEIDENATEAEVIKMFSGAADRAVESGAPVYVHFMRP